MAKVAILVPYPEMCEIARPLLEYCTEHLDVQYLEYIETPKAAQRARELEGQGCELIIARGTQAAQIKQAVRIPVVEMCVTTQELGMVMLELKTLLGEERPVIGLIGFSNMLCDTTHFNELFGLELHSYLVKRSADLAPAVELAAREGCQAVIGGEIVCTQAERLGLPGRFIPAGEESMRNALQTAERVCYAIDQEKHNSAEMDTMLNYTFSGIMQVDREGNIQRVNRAGYDLLECEPGVLMGQPVTKILPALSQSVLEETLLFGKESYALVMDIRRKAVVVNVAPIRYENYVEGALLTFQEGRRIIEMDSELRRELFRRGYIAKYSFDNLPVCSKQDEDAAAMARRMAVYNSPVLLTGEPGTGKTMMAQCIHNESLCRTNAFVTLDCSAWLPETLDTMLFGTVSYRKESAACLAELAQNGTLYLSHVEALPFESQYKLLNLIQGKFLHNGANQPVAASVRVIASTGVNLSARVEKGEFRSDLYYALSVLSLELTPLRQRREAILPWAERFLEEWQEKYKRYVHLTQGASRFLQEYDWPGNLDQLNSLCERMVLLTEKRNIDEVFLRRQLEQVTPKLLPGTEKVVLFKDQKAVQIAEALRRNDGSREKTAAELGISKTTLWRYMKKYGIETEYTY